MNKIILFVVFLPFLAYAHCSRADSVRTENYLNYYNQSTCNGIAGAYASAERSVDYSTYDWQWSVGGARFNGDEGFSFGLGKRFKQALITGSVSYEDGDEAIGFGINGKF